MKHKRLSVTWADHYSDFSQGKTIEEVRELVSKTCVRETIGYLIHETKDQLAMASTLDHNGDGSYHYSEIFVCIKSNIISRQVLEVK